MTAINRLERTKPSPYPSACTVVSSKGLIAYGLLNQLFYSVAFAFLWLGPMGAAAIATPVSGGLGATLAASVKQFGKVRPASLKCRCCIR